METKGVYLTMDIGGELFAVAVDRTREILDSITTTRLPNMPDYMIGVINVRGSVVPVVDMRLKLELPVREGKVDNPIIVLEVPGAEGMRNIGSMVDEVREVVEVSAEDMEKPPSMGRGLMTDFLAGMYQHGERLVMVLDTERLFEEDEQALFSVIDDGSASLDDTGPGSLIIKEEPAGHHDASVDTVGEEDRSPGKAEAEAFVTDGELSKAERPFSSSAPKKRRKLIRRKKKVDIQVEMKIAQEMERVGITIDELAVKIDMDKRTLKRLVSKGGPNTTIATLKRIAEGIGCHWKELVE